MLLSLLFQLFFAIAFVIAVCIFMHKMILPLAIKVVDLTLEPPRFRFGMCFLLAMIFCAMGVLQFKDFREESNLDLSRFFPLSFLVAGIFVFLGFQKQNLTK